MTLTETSGKKAHSEWDRLVRVLRAAKSLWLELKKSSRKFAACDHGAIAEGYTDIVIRGLARPEPDLEALEKLVSKDSKFDQFVNRHIDPTADIGDARKARANVSKWCKDHKGHLCGGLLQALLEVPEDTSKGEHSVQELQAPRNRRMPVTDL